VETPGSVSDLGRGKPLSCAPQSSTHARIGLLRQALG
jgi:hypothetical protein